MRCSTGHATAGAREGRMTQSAPAPGLQVVLRLGPLDGAEVIVPLDERGRPPEVYAFPCPGGRGDMLYRYEADRPALSGRLAYVWTGQAAT
jgi:hypothetical protein